jgi:prolyl 4-hydroxylase
MTSQAPTPTDPLRILEGFLDPDACQHIITSYEDRCKRSTVVVNNEDIVDPARTSSTYFLPDNDPVVIRLKEKTAMIAGIAVDQIEGLQLVRYAKGEQYKFHYDYYDEISENQRVHTILVYLNDVPEDAGGATIFKHLDRKVQPHQGRAVWFRNMNADGTMNTNSLHAGEEIRGDAVKYAVNIWTRQRKIMDLPAGLHSPELLSSDMTSTLLGPTSFLHSWIALLLGTLLLVTVLIYTVFRGSKGVQRVVQHVQKMAQPLTRFLHIT